MPTFVKLTRVRGEGRTDDVWVNLDGVQAMRRVPTFSGSDCYAAMPERTLIEFAVANQHGIPACMDVAETPAEIVDKGRAEAGWCR